MNNLPEEIKRVLNDRNGHSKEYYEDLVKAAVRKEMLPEDEIAILRKSVVSMHGLVNKLVIIISTLHPEELNELHLPELDAYNTLVESIKKSYKNF